MQSSNRTKFSLQQGVLVQSPLFILVTRISSYPYNKEMVDFISLTNAKVKVETH